MRPVMSNVLRVVFEAGEDVGVVGERRLGVLQSMSLPIFGKVQFGSEATEVTWGGLT